MTARIVGSQGTTEHLQQMLDNEHRVDDAIESKANGNPGRFRLWRPRCRAIAPSANAARDARIDLAALRKTAGRPLPVDPVERNRAWYRIYKTVENDRPRRCSPGAPPEKERLSMQPRNHHQRKSRASTQKRFTLHGGRVLWEAARHLERGQSGRHSDSGADFSGRLSRNASAGETSAAERRLRR